MAEEQNTQPNQNQKRNPRPVEDNAGKETEKKISLPEVIVLGIVAGIGDIFGIIAGLNLLIPGLGEILIITSLGLSILIFISLLFYLKMKGAVSWWFMVASIAKIFTAGVLPTQTIFFLVQVYFANHPAAGKIAQLAEGKIS